MNTGTPQGAPASATHRRVAVLAVLAVFVAILVLPASSATSGTPAAADVACARARTSEPTGLKAAAHPVVLVHGWTGSVLTDTRTALEKKMTPGWQFLLFDYHDASTQSADSPQISFCLGEYILEVSEAHHTAGGDGIVYLVGHSMGGVAARFAADQTIDYEGVSERVGDHIGGLVTLDTPHAGSPWGNTTYAFMKEFNDGVALASVPRDGSRARVCLATHVGGKGLPSGCVAAPYLSRAVPIHEIAGQGTIQRTFFGIHAYDLPLGGDAIVRSGSQQGYIGSGPASGPSSKNKVGLSTVSCQAYDGALIAEAATRSGGAYGAVLGAFAQMGSDTAALDATISNTANPGAALLLLTADAALSCSHSRMTTNDQAITATAQALRRFADTHKATTPATSSGAGRTVQSLNVQWLYESAIGVDAAGPSGQQRSYSDAGISTPNATSFWVGCEGTPAVTTFQPRGEAGTLAGTLVLDPKSTPSGLVVEVKIVGNGMAPFVVKLTQGTHVPLRISLGVATTVSLSAQVIAGSCSVSSLGYGAVADGRFI